MVPVPATTAGTRSATDAERVASTGISLIDPVTQAREGQYALRSYVTDTPQWGSRLPVRCAFSSTCQ